MSADVKPETRREILIARAAFVRGMEFFHATSYASIETEERARGLAAQAYPLPKKRVPREIVVRGAKYRIAHGRLEWFQGAWEMVGFQGGASLEWLQSLRPIIDSPEIEVEDDGHAD